MQWSRGVSGVGLNDGLRAPAIGPEAGTFVMRPSPLAAMQALLYSTAAPAISHEAGSTSA